MQDLNKIYLYRMTHIENIPYVLEYGITHANSVNANRGYMAIGDSSLITKRNQFKMPNGKNLGNYIPFYFGVRMPMLYVIQKGFNGVTVTSPENIVYCITSVEQIIKNKLEFIYTDGHAVEAFSSFFANDTIADIEKNIDKDAIRSQYWKDDIDLDKKRRKEAEFLVGGDIPQEAILGFAVYNEAAKIKMIDFGIQNDKVIIKPNFYF